MVFDIPWCGVEFYYSTSTCGADRRTVAVVITVNVVKVIKQNLQRFGQDLKKMETIFRHFHSSSLTQQTITFYSFWFHGDVAQTICKSKGCVRSSQDFLTYEDLHTLKWNILVTPIHGKKWVSFYAQMFIGKTVNVAINIIKVIESNFHVHFLKMSGLWYHILKFDSSHIKWFIIFQ